MQIVDMFIPRDAKGVLFLALAVFTLVYLVVLARGVAAIRRNAARAGKHVDATPTPARIAVGAITNFFDTLGIGSFATTTSIFRFFRMVPDETLPGTLNVGHTLGAITQTFIFTRLVPVESTTLVSMIVAAVAGSWLGAGVVAGWPRGRIQWGMGLCLLGAATLMFLSQTGLLPGGGTALGVTGGKLGIAVVGNFVLGALMTLGIGLYAPCLILVSLLGMDPIAGFPIMMGSCAFLMPVSSARFIQKRAFHVGASLGLVIGSIPAVILAVVWVTSLPLPAVRWLVIVVVVYTATNMLLTARRERRAFAPAAMVE
ncbi:MAG TPA: sulfite exporter TauE/SafE family protein [Gemmatimonadaceae bacterium]